VQRALRKEIPGALPALNPGQSAIIRLREHFLERQIVERIVKNRDLRWVLGEAHKLTLGDTEEQYLR
jgi:hypothetical protein